MTVRACEIGDTKKLVELEKECFTAPWNEGMLSGAFSRTDFLCFLLEENGTAIGYICGTTLFETADIARVAVTKSRRREGLGGLLLNAFVAAAKARGARQVFLEVRESNAPAIGLYEKQGFQKGRVRPKYYADGEDGMEMRKDV